jgi:hypothetical protein
MDSSTEELLEEKIQTIDNNLDSINETLIETNNKLERLIKIMVVK